MLPMEELSMFIKNWKTEIITIPNLLSLFRLALIPVYMRLYLNAQSPEEYYTAGGILAVSCLTDAIDGQVARRFHMITNVGKILDPLADKATQFAVLLCLMGKYPFLQGLMLLFAVKELFQLAAGAANLRKGKMLPGALMAGKVSTAVLFVSLILLVLFPGLSTRTVKTISLVDTLFLAGSFVSYLIAYLGKHTKVQDLPE